MAVEIKVIGEIRGFIQKPWESKGKSGVNYSVKLEDLTSPFYHIVKLTETQYKDLSLAYDKGSQVELLCGLDRFAIKRGIESYYLKM